MHLLCFQFQSNSTVEPILPSFITNFPPPQGETWLPLPSTYLLTYSDPENTESTFKIAHLQWKANLLITRIKYLLTVFFSNAYIIFSWFACVLGKLRLERRWSTVESSELGVRSRASLSCWPTWPWTSDIAFNHGALHSNRTEKSPVLEG